MSINWRDVLERAAWTFVEGFVVALPVTIEAGMDGAAWKSVLVGAAMAGVSAVKTFVVDMIRRYAESKKEEK